MLPDSSRGHSVRYVLSAEGAVQPDTIKESRFQRYQLAIVCTALKIAQRFNAGNPGREKHRVLLGTTEARLDKDRSKRP